jgi:acyl-coenzyme A thioesterase PaaI-like protein
MRAGKVIPRAVQSKPLQGRSQFGWTPSANHPVRRGTHGTGGTRRTGGTRGTRGTDDLDLDGGVHPGPDVQMRIGPGVAAQYRSRGRAVQRPHPADRRCRQHVTPRAQPVAVDLDVRARERDEQPGDDRDGADEAAQRQQPATATGHVRAEDDDRLDTWNREDQRHRPPPPWDGTTLTKHRRLGVGGRGRRAGGGHHSRLRSLARRQPARRVVSPLVTQPPGRPATPDAQRAHGGDDLPGLLTPLVLPPDLVPAVPARDAPPPGSALGQHYARCYGCGEAQPGGLRMRFTVGEGVRVVSEFEVTDNHEGAAGLAHGGLLTAALDETQATLLWVLRMPAVTARLETDFLTPVPVGSTVRIEAGCLGVSQRKIFTTAQGRLLDADGRPGDVAMRSVALFIAVPVEHFVAFGRPDLVHASMNRSVEDVEVNP